MNVTIAESRADINVLLDRLKGTHPSSVANRIAAVVISACFGAIAILFAASDRVLLAIAPLFIGAIALFLDEGFATFIADASGFTRRSLFRNWHVRPDEVHSIEVPLGTSVLIIAMNTGKRRTVPIGRDVKKAFAKVYLELFGEPEDTPAANPEVLRGSMRSAGRGSVLALIFAAVALASSAWHPGDPLLQMVNEFLRMAAWSSAVATICVSLLLVAMAALARIGQKGRVILCGSALAAVLAMIGYTIWLNLQ